MIPLHVRSLIEEKYGRPIRYPKDCEGLSADIATVCKEQISASTLKRLFGFVKSTTSPSRYTLDVMAQYIGYPEWSSIPQNIPVPAAGAMRADHQEKEVVSGRRFSPLMVTLIIFVLVVVTAALVILTNQGSPQESNKILVTDLPGLPEARAGGAMLRDGNFIYYIGGSDAEFMRDNNWCYDLIAGEWNVLTPMPTPRAHSGCTLLNGVIYCFGGWRGNDSGMTNVAEAFDISTNSWRTLEPLPYNMTSVSSVSVGDKIYILGGTMGETKNYFYRYDPLTNKYDSLPVFSTQRLHANIVNCKNQLYVMGGQSFTNGSYVIHDNSDKFVPDENRWISLASMPAPVMRSAISSSGSKIFAVCGTNKIGEDTAGLLSKLYTFDIELNRWSSFEIACRLLGAAGVAEDKKLYVAGGHSEFPNPTSRFFEITLPE